MRRYWVLAFWLVVVLAFAVAFILASCEGAFPPAPLPNGGGGNTGRPPAPGSGAPTHDTEPMWISRKVHP